MSSVGTAVGRLFIVAVLALVVCACSTNLRLDVKGDEPAARVGGPPPPPAQGQWVPPEPIRRY